MDHHFLQLAKSTELDNEVSYTIERLINLALNKTSKDEWKDENYKSLTKTI